VPSAGELTPDYNPVEAGLLFACELSSDIGFLGRAAVEKGGGRVLVGQVTSAAWGEALGAFEIDVGGRADGGCRVPAGALRSRGCKIKKGTSASVTA
jgi:hypothetical protein